MPEYKFESDASRYAWAWYRLFVAVSSLIGDTTILIASIKYRAFKLHKLNIVPIQQIAFCDLMVSLSNVLPNFVSVACNEWVLGNFLCGLTSYANYYFYVTGTLLICNMTSSKVLLMKYPLQVGTISEKKAHILCIVCWIVAMTIPVVFLLVDGLDGKEYYFSYEHTFAITFKDHIGIGLGFSLPSYSYSFLIAWL